MRALSQQHVKDSQERNQFRSPGASDQIPRQGPVYGGMLSGAWGSLGQGGWVKEQMRPANFDPRESITRNWPSASRLIA
jgi:hypothetical protein